jgi:hypothetical protein
MTSLEQVLVVVSGFVEHERDFAFRKNSGEIANRVRAEFSEGKYREFAALQEIFIDEEDDIGVRTEKGTWYLTPTSVSIVGWPVRLGDLYTTGCLGGLAGLMESLLESRKMFKAELLSVRLFFLPKLTPESDLRALEQLAYSPLVALFGERAPQDGATSRFLTTFRSADFDNTLELEIKGKEIELRYTREATASAFPSYLEFLEKAQLGHMADDLRTTLEKIPFTLLPGAPGSRPAFGR